MSAPFAGVTSVGARRPPIIYVAPASLPQMYTVYLYICDNFRTFLFRTLEVVVIHLQQSMHVNVDVCVLCCRPRTGSFTNWLYNSSVLYTQL